MLGKITHLAVLVKNQDEALAFYTEKLGFAKTQDSTFPNGFRWLMVAPPEGEVALVLMPVSGENLASVGRQSGNVSMMVMTTPHIQKTYQELQSRGVKLSGAPSENPWGMAFQFEDLYGNKIDVFEPKQ